LFGLIFSATFLFIEPIFLSTWGTTPGKALLNIRLRLSYNSKPDYMQALNRSLKVWFRGEGLGIPLVNLVTLIYAHNQLTREGITTWDMDGGFRVAHKKISAWRVVVIIVYFLIIVGILATDV
jgi:hypothetical protein